MYVLVKRARFPASSLVRIPSGLAPPLRVKRGVLARTPLSRGIKNPRPLAVFPSSLIFPAHLLPSLCCSFRDSWPPFLPTIADRRATTRHATSSYRSSALNPHLRPPISVSPNYTWEQVVERPSLHWPPPDPTTLPQFISNVLMMPFEGGGRAAKCPAVNSSRSAPSHPVYLRQPPFHPCSADSCFCNGTN